MSGDSKKLAPHMLFGSGPIADAMRVEMARLRPEPACPHAVGPEPACFECRIEARVAELEEQLAAFESCADCGIVFADHHAYSEHFCHGRQGR